MEQKPTMSIEEAGLLFRNMKEGYKWIRRVEIGTLIIAKKLPQSEEDENNSNLAYFPYPLLYSFIDEDSDWFRIKSLFRNVCIDPNLDDDVIVTSPAIFTFNEESTKVEFPQFPDLFINKESFDEALNAAYTEIGKRIYEGYEGEKGEGEEEEGKDGGEIGEGSSKLRLDLILDMRFWELKNLKQWDA